MTPSFYITGFFSFAFTCKKSNYNVAEETQKDNAARDRRAAERENERSKARQEMRNTRNRPQSGTQDKSLPTSTSGPTTRA